MAAAIIAVKKKQARKVEAAKALARQVKEDEDSRVRMWFQEFDHDQDGLLDRQDLTRLLEHLHGGAEALSQEAVNLIFDQAMVNDTVGDGDGEHALRGFTPDTVVAAVTKYSDYARDQSFLDYVFDLFDPDKSGKLEAKQLRALLEHIEASRNRAPEVSDEAAEYVLKQCDVDGTGSISRDECLALVATWTRVCDKRPWEAEEEALQPQCCTIL